MKNVLVKVIFLIGSSFLSFLQSANPVGLPLRSAYDLFYLPGKFSGIDLTNLAKVTIERQFST